MKTAIQRGWSIHRLLGIGIALAGLVAPMAWGDEVIVESREGGLNFDRYSESGVWEDYGLKSAAPGCTAGIGARSTRNLATPSFTVSPVLSTPGGAYEVYVTLPTNSAPADLVVEILQTGCSGLPAETDLFNRNSPAVSPNWGYLGTLILAPGEDTPSITFRYKSGSLTLLSRFYADAVRFVETVPCTVAITEQPESTSVPAGTEATFDVVATGVGTLHYQWFVNDAPAGTDSPTLVLPAVQLADDGSTVSVEVSDDNCSLGSDEVILTVTEVPILIETQPRSITVAEGNDAIFQVVATGPGELHYQWFVNGSPAGTDEASLVLPAVQLADSGAQVHVVVSDGVNNVQSDTAILTVITCNTPFADADGDLDIDQSDFAEFQLCFTGDGFGNMLGGSCACFDREPEGGDGDVDRFDLSVFEAYATGPAIPWVEAATIIGQPENVTVGRGATAVFSVTAAGAGTLHYQWYRNNQPIGTDAPELALPAVQQADDGALVHVVVTDNNGSATSQTATLTVVPCNLPYADADADGDVDPEDYAVFQVCYTGTFPPMWADPYCYCFDRDPAGSDGDVDEDDLDQFENCATGPQIPWAAEDHPDCIP